jgi:hypothetical protein
VRNLLEIALQKAHFAQRKYEQKRKEILGGIRDSCEPRATRKARNSLWRDERVNNDGGDI